MSGEAKRPVPKVLVPLRTVDTFFRRIEVTVLVLVVLTMIGLSFAQVATRVLRPYFPFIQPVAWFDTLARHLVLWVGVLGASIAAREGRHFGVEALPKLFSERGRRRLEGVLNVIAGVVSALLTQIMWNKIVLDEIPRSRPPENHHLFVVGLPGGGSLPVPEWWLLGIIPIGLAGMTYRFLLRSLEAALLTDGEWHDLEHELKPDLAAAAEPSRDVAPAPPAPPLPPKLPPPPPNPPLWTPVPRVVSETASKKPSTEKVRRRALGDLEDVDDPEPHEAATDEPDAFLKLVDSDDTTGEEEPPITPTTERAGEIDPAAFDSTPDGRAPGPDDPDREGKP